MIWVLGVFVDFRGCNMVVPHIASPIQDEALVGQLQREQKEDREALPGMMFSMRKFHDFSSFL